MNGFFEHFAGGEFPLTATIMVMVVVFLFIVLMMFVPALTRRIFPKFGYARYAQYVPFKTVYTDDSMTLTDGSIVRVYHVDGVQTSMQDDETRAKFLDLRTQLFNQIRDPNVVIRFYTVRDAVGENTNYEFELYGAKELLDDTEDLSNIFNSCQILSIQETDKVGLDI